MVAGAGAIVHLATLPLQNCHALLRLVLHRLEDGSRRLALLGAQRQVGEASGEVYVQVSQMLGPTLVPQRAREAGAGGKGVAVRERIEREQPAKRVAADGT